MGSQSPVRLMRPASPRPGRALDKGAYPVGILPDTHKNIGERELTHGCHVDGFGEGNCWLQTALFTCGERPDSAGPAS